MNRTLLWGLGGAVLLYAVLNRQQIADVTQSGVDDVTAAVAGWKNVQAGPQWVPIINGIEQQYGIPADLLARVAYQESHFRPEIVSGALASPAGALGLMQMMPQYFTSVQVPVPFSAQDTVNQINQAAALLQSLYAHFSDWGLALAGYNDGQGNINQFVAGNRALPDETSAYVSDILSDVPVASSLTLA